MGIKNIGKNGFPTGSLRPIGNLPPVLHDNGHSSVALAANVQQQEPIPSVILQQQSIATNGPCGIDCLDDLVLSYGFLSDLVQEVVCKMQKGCYTSEAYFMPLLSFFINIGDKLKSLSNDEAELADHGPDHFMVSKLIEIFDSVYSIAGEEFFPQPICLVDLHAIIHDLYSKSTNDNLADGTIENSGEAGNPILTAKLLKSFLDVVSISINDKIRQANINYNLEEYSYLAIMHRFVVEAFIQLGRKNCAHLSGLNDVTVCQPLSVEVHMS